MAFTIDVNSSGPLPESNRPTLEDLMPGIELEQRRAREIADKGTSDDWQPGGGTSGICAAFAFECVDHVAKYGDADVVPPLFTTTPTDQMKFLEMLLIQGIYKALDKNQDYDSVTLTEENRELVNHACKAFADLVRSQTGLKIVGQYPEGRSAPDFSVSLPMDQRRELFEAISQRDQEHHLLFLRNPNAHLKDGHIVYVNPKKGIIADGASGFIWKIPSTHKHLFNEALDYYIKKYHASSYKQISSIAIEKTFNLKSKVVPLALRKLLMMYPNLLYNIGRTQGIKAAAGAAATYVSGNKSVKKIGSAWESAKNAFNVTRSLTQAIYDPAQRLKVFKKACVNGNLKTIKLLLKMGMDPNAQLDEPYPNPLSSALASFYRHKNLDVIKLLVEAGAELNPGSYEGVDDRNDFENDQCRPINLAINGKNSEVFEYLLSKGARLTPQDLQDALRPDFFTTGSLREKDKITQRIIEIGVNKSHESLRLAIEDAIRNESLGVAVSLVKSGYALPDNDAFQHLMYRYKTEKSRAKPDQEKIEKYEEIIRELLKRNFDLKNYQINGGDGEIDIAYLKANLLTSDQVRDLGL